MLLKMCQKQAQIGGIVLFLISIKYFCTHSKVFSNKEHIFFYIQTEIISFLYVDVQYKYSYISSAVISSGHISSQSLTGLCYLKIYTLSKMVHLTINSQNRHN